MSFMNTKEIGGMQRKTRGGFTLIELMVVIAIIGILAGLLMPVMASSIGTAHRTRDLSNAKQTVTVLVQDAMDNDGKFRLGRDETVTTPTATTLDVFQGLLNLGKTDDPGIFYGEGARAATSDELTDENIGFHYVAGLKTSSSSRMPLVFTKGVDLTEGNLTGKTFAPGTSAWEKKGFIIGFVGGNAQWMANTDGEETTEIELAAPLLFNDPPAGIKVYQ